MASILILVRVRTDYTNEHTDKPSKCTPKPDFLNDQVDLKSYNVAKASRHSGKEYVRKEVLDKSRKETLLTKWSWCVRSDKHHALFLRIELNK